MNELLLFTDGSVNTKTKIGFGACLALVDLNLPFDSIKSLVKIKRFEQTSSTKLELETLLWALGDIDSSGCRVTVYTDSQNIVGLPGRRERFEKNDYRSKKNRRLNHYKLYQAFFRLTDQLCCDFVKVRGHQVSRHKELIDQLFTLVDRASRKSLRDGLGDRKSLA